ncbi:hypothetical protein [Actinomadura parmotrematis]|uniref:Uncharacterized protein n=1 Tax=Actinomadura parmotrematis TaxID=2864039 RepID=A0ABS7FZD9_9ACTN|nr:hypothetical protein [Actinomadura parmotrematis]MBW8485819.1 hypothetical protein [Actinomadura parmotrematis]
MPQGPQSPPPAPPPTRGWRRVLPGSRNQPPPPPPDLQRARANPLPPKPPSAEPPVQPVREGGPPPAPAPTRPDIPQQPAPQQRSAPPQEPPPKDADEPRRSWRISDVLGLGKGEEQTDEPPRPPAERPAGPPAGPPEPPSALPVAEAAAGRPAAPRREERPEQKEAPPDPMADPERRRALVDGFVDEFVGGATWQATLAVLEGAFPGLGMASTLSGRADELWRAGDVLDRSGGRKLGLPVWTDGMGMVFDLSARRAPGAPRGPRAGHPRASRPYAGAFVIDTLDPLRYHRAVGGPRPPQDGVPEPRSAEEDDTGVVIVAELSAAGARVLDSVALWRHAGRVVTATLDDPLSPPSRVRARRALRALRRVVFVDPVLGVGLCLQIDAARTPRCLLAFAVDRTEVTAPRFVRV